MILEDLLKSNQSILLNLEELRRRQRSETSDAPAGA
jgi:hypothetical protein